MCPLNAVLCLWVCIHSGCLMDTLTACLGYSEKRVTLQENISVPSGIDKPLLSLSRSPLSHCPSIQCLPIIGSLCRVWTLRLHSDSQTTACHQTDGVCVYVCAQGTHIASQAVVTPVSQPHFKPIHRNLNLSKKSTAKEKIHHCITEVFKLYQCFQRSCAALRGACFRIGKNDEFFHFKKYV